MGAVSARRRDCALIYVNRTPLVTHVAMQVLLRSVHGEVLIPGRGTKLQTALHLDKVGENMAPLLCVTYRDVEPLPQIEDGISTFAEELVRACDSVTRCELLIGRSPSPASQGGTWFVRATLHVFGHSIRVVRFQPDLLHGDALKIAFREILAQAANELSAISREHHGCGCGGQCEVAPARIATPA